MFWNVLISKLMKKILKLFGLSCDKSKNIVCGCVYRHPKTDIYELTSYISKCLTKISKEKKESSVTGDFIVDLQKYDSSNKHQKNLNLMTSHGFFTFYLTTYY